VREGRRHRAVAVAREQDRSQRFDDLFTRAMDRAVSSLEEEVFANELWVVTHELAHQWNLWSGAVAAQLLDDTVCVCTFVGGTRVFLFYLVSAPVCYPCVLCPGSVVSLNPYTGNPVGKTC